MNRLIGSLHARQAEPRVNKILVKLSRNELKQMGSQLGKAMVRVLNEKKTLTQT